MMKRVPRINFFFLIAVLFPALASGAVLPINKFGGLNTDESALTLQSQSPDSENVVTDDGMGLHGRKGFVRYSTEPSAGVWEFPKSNGTRYIITRSGGNLKADTGDGTFDVQVSTIPTDRITVGAVLGDRFYFANTTDGIKYWDGSTVRVASAALTVDKLVSHKGRLWANGKNGSERTLYISRYLDGTDFVLETNPTDDGPAQLTIAGALDENVQALYASFQDKLIWMKKNSFGGIYGNRRSNFTQRVFSDVIGVSSAETIRDCEGRLRWLGTDRIIWEFDGASIKKISEAIDNLVSTVLQGDANSRSMIQTAQADWDAGTQNPTGFATTSGGSVGSKVTTSGDSYTTDIGGTVSPTGWIDAPDDGYAYLAGAAAISSFLDDTQSDFSAGTLTNASATQTSGAVELTKTTSERQSVYNADSGAASMGTQYQSFTAVSTYKLTSIKFRTVTAYSSPLTLTVAICADNGISPGTILSQTDTTLPFSGGAIDRTITLSSPVSLTSGTRYWIKWVAGSHAWEKQAVVANGEYYNNGGGVQSGTIFKYALTGYNYAASGNIVSRTFDVGFTTDTWLWDWSTFIPGTDVPAGCEITYETQTSADGTNWDSLVSVANNGLPASTVRRYIRYKATLTTSDIRVTPQLRDVGITMSDRRRPYGTLTEDALDTGLINPVWGPFTYVQSVAGSGGASEFYTQSSADGITWDNRVVATQGGKIGSARKRYLRWIWVSTATSQGNYDKLDQVSVTHTATGTFTTQTFPVGTNISAWGPITINDATTGQGAITYEFSASANGTFSVWNTIAKTGTPTVSTQPYAAIRAHYIVGSSTDTALTSDITLTWIEGSTIRAASGYYGQRYYVSIATTGTTNNVVLVYDKNNQWQKYTGIQADVMGMYNSRLYFGNTSGIFLTETGYSDNGTAITAYYKTPSMAPTSLDLYSAWDYLFMTTDNSDSTLATNFYVNGSTTAYSLGSYQMNATSGLQNFKLPFSVGDVQTGKYIDLKWTVTGTSFWRILNGNLYYQPSLIPE